MRLALWIAAVALSFSSITSGRAAGYGPDSGSEESAAVRAAALCSDAKTRGAELAAGTRTEPTANQRAYDARYYGIRLDIDPLTRTIEGSTDIRATVVQGPLRYLDFDLVDDLVVTGVRERTDSLDMVAVTFQRSSRGIVRVDLSRAYAAGEDVTLEIAYNGTPSTSGFHFDRQANQPMIWTLSAPYGGRAWWACKDYPEDKADSVDIRVTVPANLEVASNGVRMRDDVINGLRHVWWRERHAIATYLVSLAIHPYAVYSDWYHPLAGQPAGVDSMEIRFFNFQSSQAGARPVQAKVKDMIAAFAERFGEYPFLDEKYGHAEFLFGGGMENQTISSLGSYDEMVVAHELSHQWWGDLVTCADYRDVWLNEGFATYCEALWAEETGGAAAYHRKMAQTTYFGDGTIYVDNVDSFSRIYDRSLSYLKGSWVVHMLRHVVGDETFYRVLREYRARFDHGVATTNDLESVAEEVSGKDLTAFFRQWIREERYPLYRYDWDSAPAGGGWDLTLRLRQVQDWQLFTMPVDVAVTAGGETQRFVVDNSTADTTYVLHLDAEPQSVTLDPDNWILCRILKPISEPTFSKPLLLVNGMFWNSPAPTPAEIRRSYESGAFTGGYAFEFWDCFDAPAGGYPSNLPEPIGHGPVPGEILGNYQSVVWLSNNLGGDVTHWQNTPMHSYLESGGNLLLMTRDAASFLSPPFRKYLEIEWAGTDTIYDCVATYDGLGDLRPTGLQSTVSWFAPEDASESTLLYKSAAGHYPEWGIGILRQPAEGGTHRADGGKFILLNGRPYRWDTEDLRRNISFLLTNFFPQEVNASVGLTLPAAVPNPVRGPADIRFHLPAPGPANLTLWDVTGRTLRVLRDGSSPAGWNSELWDGKDGNGERVPAGVYFLRLTANGTKAQTKVVVIR